MKSHQFQTVTFQRILFIICAALIVISLRLGDPENYSREIIKTNTPYLE